jgi:hypothetical protein
MKDKSEILNFIAQREKLAQECRKMDALVKKYKMHTPCVIPVWDRSEQSINHNEICEPIIDSGLVLYTAPFDAVWAGIYDPSVYESDTLWSDIHDSKKIARVIEHWSNGQALSPIFLVKHGSKNLGLVADGKHRLMVARYMGCDEIPFMVERANSEWVSIAIPSATKI